MRAALLLAVLVAGCAQTPRPSATVQPLPPAYFTPLPGQPSPSEWWRRRLSDPALARLVAAALGSAPDLAAATARIEVARAGLRLSEAERLPALNGSASVTYNRSAAQEFGFQTGDGAGQGGPQIDRERVLYRAGIEGSWDADLFGRLAADARAARARLDAAGFDAAAVRLALVTEVARNFVAARAAVARAATARANIASATETVSVTQTRVRAGIAPGIDTIRAEALRAELAAGVPPLQAEERARIAALATLTGLAPAAIAPLVRQRPDPPRFGAPAAGVPSDLLLRRPDIAAAAARIAAADADTASAVAARFPRLSITATIGLVATALGDLFSGDALSIVAGPGLAGPLLDFGRNRARADQARARALEAVAAWRGTVLRAFGEVETSLAAVEARGRQLVAIDRQLAANREAVEVSRRQYRAGLTDFLGVLDAERALNRTRDQRVAAQAEAADAELATFRAIGGDFVAAN